MPGILCFLCSWENGVLKSYFVRKISEPVQWMMILKILNIMPNCRLWYLDGKDEKGKIVTNPNIGYGFQTIKNADGKTKEFYQIGISANTTGSQFIGKKEF